MLTYLKEYVILYIKIRKGKKMNIYTVILLTICILTIGVELGLHGQTEIVEHNFWSKLIGQLIAILLILKATNIL